MHFKISCFDFCHRNNYGCNTSSSMSKGVGLDILCEFLKVGVLKRETFCLILFVSERNSWQRQFSFSLSPVNPLCVTTLSKCNFHIQFRNLFVCLKECSESRKIIPRLTYLSHSTVLCRSQTEILRSFEDSWHIFIKKYTVVRNFWIHVYSSYAVSDEKKM